MTSFAARGMSSPDDLALHAASSPGEGQSALHEARELGIVNPDRLPRGVRVVVEPVGVFQYVT
jgi:hypothetical protein